MRGTSLPQRQQRPIPRECGKLFRCNALCSPKRLIVSAAYESCRCTGCSFCRNFVKNHFGTIPVVIVIRSCRTVRIRTQTVVCVCAGKKRQCPDKDTNSQNNLSHNSNRISFYFSLVRQNQKRGERSPKGVPPRLMFLMLLLLYASECSTNLFDVLPFSWKIGSCDFIALAIELKHGNNNIITVVTYCTVAV